MQTAAQQDSAASDGSLQNALFGQLMIFEIQHETRLRYSAPVVESIAELRMEPISVPGQSCRSFILEVAPSAEVFRYHDGFGNRVHHFNLLPAHDEVRILAASLVEVIPNQRDLALSTDNWPLNVDQLELDVIDYLTLRGPTRKTPLLNPVLDELCPSEGTRMVDLVLQVAHYISTRYQYAREVTLATSPIDDVLAHGKGVCQDFTHLMIAILRSFSVPARYVSGYIHRPNKESQSHAWCEAWIPDCGWLGVDPTNDCVVNDHFIKVAVGRDFSDVTPNKGIYRGSAQETISVRVETRELKSLPSLSWQEQLPPLEVPLTDIVTRLFEPPNESDQQQQQ